MSGDKDDVRRQRWTDSFHRIFPATAMGLTSKTSTVLVLPKVIASQSAHKNQLNSRTLRADFRVS